MNAGGILRLWTGTGLIRRLHDFKSFMSLNSIMEEEVLSLDHTFHERNSSLG